MKNVKPLLVVAIFLVFFGCSKQSTVDISVESVSKLPSSLIEKMKFSDQIKSLKAYARVELFVHGKKKTLDMAIILNAPDTIRLDFVDNVAGPIATIIATPKQVLYGDKDGVSLYHGNECGEAFKKMLRLPWLPEQTIKIFTGGVPVEISPTNQYDRDAKGRFWVVEKSSAVYWDEMGGSISYLELDNGKEVAQINYGAYKQSGRIEYPSEITINFAYQKSLFKLVYKDVEINVPIDPVFFNQINLGDDEIGKDKGL